MCVVKRDWRGRRSCSRRVLTMMDMWGSRMYEHAEREAERGLRLLLEEWGILNLGLVIVE